MQDEPTPTELVQAVADFLRNDVAPLLSGHDAFKLRVGINALDLVVRQLTQAAPAEAAEFSRLKQLLGQDGDLLDLNRALAELIASGAVDLDTPGLKAHLWQTTLDKLTVDQPNYASYKCEAGRDQGEEGKGVT
ncbi:MAG: DUF6285 domain-containing protein [Bradyrhizobium sp.]